MDSQIATQNSTCCASQSYHPAFDLERSQPSPIAAGTVELHRHRALGFEVLVHRTLDPNKVFCVSFQTPRDKADGLPHILEHLVLAGSKEFPVKDPFFSTRKGSFNSYLNASTAQEHTMFPVATTSGPELFNLSRIYLDAVFHPLLTETAFHREGWRLERADTGEYRFDGVVYGEMKGAYSNPTKALYRALVNNIFHDTHHGKDSGGQPSVIPELSHGELVNYHRAHYHPSRARILVHGDLNPEGLAKMFHLIDEKVEGFERSAFVPTLALHSSADSHRRVEVALPADPKLPEGAPLASIAWPLGQIADPEERMMWNVLESVLLGGEASPLRYELLRRGAAATVVTSGVVLTTADNCFLVSGKDVSKEDPGRFAGSVKEILAEIVAQGLSTDDVNATLSELEFKLRQGDTDEPRGVEIASWITPGWLRGEDPICLMDQLDMLRRVRERLALEPRALETLIRERLLDNPESVEVILRPSWQEHQAAEERERDHAARCAASLGESGITRHLAVNDQMCEQCDDPAALERIPCLGVSDMPRMLRGLDNLASRWSDGDIARGTVATSGITYTSLGFDLTHLPDRLIAFAPLMARTLGSVDTTRSLGEFDRDVRSNTGGLRFSIDSGSDREMGERNMLMVAGSALDDQSPKLVDLISEAILEAKIERDRFQEILSETISNMELRIARSGHAFALSEAKRATSEVFARASLLGGFEQLAFLRRVRERLESDWKGIQRDLQAFRGVFRRGNVVAGQYAGLERQAQRALALERAVSELPVVTDYPHASRSEFALGESALGIPWNTEVAYIATAKVLPESELRGLYGAMLVLNRCITYDHLVPEIRGKNGAYGAGSLFNPSSGLFATYTYRSNARGIANDLAAIQRIQEFIRERKLSDSDVSKLVVGTVSDFAPHQHPRQAADADFKARCFGPSYENRELWYEEILRCTPVDLRRAAEVLVAHGSSPHIRVVSSERALREAGLQVR